MSAVGCFEHGPLRVGVESDIPLALVHEVMMKPADQNQIFEFGFAMEGPVNDVVRFADSGVGATSGERTSAVA